MEGAQGEPIWQSNCAVGAEVGFKAVIAYVVLYYYGELLCVVFDITHIVLPSSIRPSMDTTPDPAFMRTSEPDTGTTESKCVNNAYTTPVPLYGCGFGML